MKCVLGSAALALVWACTAAPTSEPTSIATPREASARKTPLPFHIAVAPPSENVEREQQALAEALSAELDGTVFARATVARDAQADLFLEWTLASDGGVDVSLCDVSFELALSRSALLAVSMEAPVDVRALADRLAELCPGALFPADDVLRLDWEALSIETEPARLDGGVTQPRVTVEGAVEIPPTARLSRLRSASVVAVVPPGGTASDAIASGPTTLGPAELLPDGARRFEFRVEGVPAVTPFLRLELVAGSRELVRRGFTLRVPEAQP